MVRDRLAAHRAKISSPSAPTTTAQDEETHEMASRKVQSVPISSMKEFYDEITSVQDALKEFNANVSQISDLHSRSLKLLDGESTQYNAAQLEELVAKTRALGDSIRTKIQHLRQGSDTLSNRDKKIQAQQTAVVAQRFVEAIQRYQQVEKQYRDQSKDRVRRQLKIVNPNATAEEIEAATAGGVDGQQVFAQALQSSSRYGESRLAYKEVQERNQDIQQIEHSLTELAQLFNDMSVIVTQQDETIKEIEATAIETEARTETALRDTKKAVLSAMRARRARWICFFICLLIIVVLGLVLGLHFGLSNGGGGDGGSGGNNSSNGNNG